MSTPPISGNQVQDSHFLGKVFGIGNPVSRFYGVLTRCQIESLKEKLEAGIYTFGVIFVLFVQSLDGIQIHRPDRVVGIHRFFFGCCDFLKRKDANFVPNFQ